MATKNSSPTQSELIMIIAEERNTLRTIFDDIKPDDDGHRYIPNHKFQILNIRSRYNPDLRFYKVNCEAYKRYGYTADELFDEIYDKYIESGYEPLDELFTFIERIQYDIKREKQMASF